MIEMIPIYLFCLLYFVYAYTRHKDLVAVNTKAVFNFIGIMLFISALRVIGMYLDGSAPQYGGSIIGLTMVWWEDVFFTLPLLIAYKQNVSKYILIPATILSSIAFAVGHLYISVPWALFLLIYIYFISFKYRLKYGLGTVMICHVVYDLMTVMSSYIAGGLLK